MVADLAPQLCKKKNLLQASSSFWNSGHGIGHTELLILINEIRGKDGRWGKKNNTEFKKKGGGGEKEGKKREKKK